MRHHLIALSAAALLAVAGIGTANAAPATPTFFAAPNGSGNACSTANPCALTTAQQKARTTTGATVQLADGTYHLSQTLTFDAALGDSGTTYQAAPGAHPVLSGGEQVTGWHQGTGGVWSANVPAGTDTRQLYVNGVRALRASGPNPADFTRTATGYTMSNTTMDSWGNISDVEFVYNVNWTQVRCGVASVSGTTLTMQQPCFDNSSKKQYGSNIDTPSYVENAKELLTNPGQFYLDKTAHTLYYLPREGQNLATADVEIPHLQTLVDGRGTEAAPLNGLTFRGIGFEYAGWTEPNGPDGFSEVQANVRLTGNLAWEYEGTCDRFSSTDPGTCPYGAWTMTPGNVVFDHTTGLSITGDTFEHLGAAGLQLGQDADNSSITGNNFTDISGNGLEIGNGTDADPTDLALIPANNTVADNWVHNVAVEYSGGVGIFQGYARYDTIEHNQVNDVPYSGISSNWGWGHPQTATMGDKILDNLVYDAMQQHYDGGGIYVLGQEGDSLADGMLISGNVVRNLSGSGNGIYTDGGSQYVTMTGNAVYATDSPSFGGCREGGGTPYGDFNYTGNYFADTTPNFVCGAPDNAVTAPNTQVDDSGDGVPASLIVNAGLEPAYASLAAPPAGKLPVNLALHKPAQAQYIDGSTAQLQPGSQASFATDGDPATYTQATAQYRWQLVVDLQKPQTLGYLTLSMPQDRFATDFHVDISTDDSNWTTVATVHDSGWGSDPVDFATPVTARYLRIVADAPDNGGQRGGQMAISELAAYAPGCDPDNLALNQPSQALFIDGTQAQLQPNSLPSYGNDGNPATFVQATNRYRWSYQVDLQHPRNVDVVSVLMPDSAYATAFHIDVSLDGTTFWTVGRRVDSAGGLTAVQLDEPVQARYIRVIADHPDDGGQTGGQMAISELGAYSGS